ncbi:MAG TPA: hypothetical protein VGP90_02045, partial [Acidimicrobiia bacterium]|nr:hypothetical protein [Acidimicrobiia bacterium]
SAQTANILDETVSVSGTHEVGSPVTVVASDGVHSTTPVTAALSGGTWSTTIDVSALDNGTITYSATAVDAAANSNVGVGTGKKDILAPTFDSLTAVGGSTHVTLTFSEPVLCSSVNAVGFLAVVNGGLPSLVLGVGCVGTSSSTLTGTLTSAPSTGQSVQIGVAVAAVTDEAGNTSLLLGSQIGLAS